MNQGDPGLGLSARIAVNTGEVVVVLSARPELGEGMVTGDVVNTASRLQGVAPVGGVAVGEGTYRLTKDYSTTKKLTAVEVKGKTGAVRLWWAKNARSHLGVETERKAGTPFVGRRYELTICMRTPPRGGRPSRSRSSKATRSWAPAAASLRSAGKTKHANTSRPRAPCSSRWARSR